MTPKEMKELIKAETVKYNITVKNIKRKYVDSLFRYKKGTILQDHIGYGEVISVLYDINNDDPGLVYLCKELTIKKVPKKNKRERYFYPQNLKK